MERASGLPGTMIAGVCPVLGSVVDKVAIDAVIYRKRKLMHRRSQKHEMKHTIDNGSYNMLT